MQGNMSNMIIVKFVCLNSKYELSYIYVVHQRTLLNKNVKVKMPSRKGYKMSKCVAFGDAFLTINSVILDFYL